MRAGIRAQMVGEVVVGEGSVGADSVGEVEGEAVGEELGSSGGGQCDHYLLPLQFDSCCFSTPTTCPTSCLFPSA